MKNKIKVLIETFCFSLVTLIAMVILTKTHPEPISLDQWLKLAVVGAGIPSILYTIFNYYDQKDKFYKYLDSLTLEPIELKYLRLSGIKYNQQKIFCEYLLGKYKLKVAVKSFKKNESIYLNKEEIKAGLKDWTIELS